MGLEFCVCRLWFSGCWDSALYQFRSEECKGASGLFLRLKTGPLGKEGKIYLLVFADALLGATIGAVSFVSIAMGRSF